MMIQVSYAPKFSVPRLLTIVDMTKRAKPISSLNWHIVFCGWICSDSKTIMMGEL